MTNLVVHGTCVAVNGKGLLLRGPSGCGKSDLALRLVDRGALVVADDLTCLNLKGEGVVATIPAAAEAQRGVMEIRGIGLVHVPHAPEAPLCLVIDLAAHAERFPEPQTLDILGAMIPHLTLNPFEASAAIKAIAALEWSRFDG